MRIPLVIIKVWQRMEFATLLAEALSDAIHTQDVQSQMHLANTIPLVIFLLFAEVFATLIDLSERTGCEQGTCNHSSVL